jgi:hypothetical protein
MTQRSIDAVTEATTPKPLSPLQDSALGLHNLFHNITLGADTGLLGLANPQVSEDLAAARKQWQAAHPYQSFGQGVIGPLPATLAGMGVVGRGLTAAGGEIASAFPSTAGAITQTGRFLSGQLGSWAGASEISSPGRETCSDSAHWKVQDRELHRAGLPISQPSQDAWNWRRNWRDLLASAAWLATFSPRTSSQT